MTVSGIAFTPELLEAILLNRKTETRRVIPQANMAPKNVPPIWADAVYPAAESGWISWKGLTPPGKWLEEETKRRYQHGFLCPYGQPGRSLYIKEGLRRTPKGTAAYVNGPPVMVDGKPLPWQWRNQGLPPRFMPKVAARTWVELTGVAVERTTDITEAGARAEGVTPWEGESYRDAFIRKWNSINGRRGFRFEDGCWIWVLTFKWITMRGNTIDQLPVINDPVISEAVRSLEDE